MSLASSLIYRKILFSHVTSALAAASEDWSLPLPVNRYESAHQLPTIPYSTVLVVKSAVAYNTQKSRVQELCFLSAMSALSLARLPTISGSLMELGWLSPIGLSIRTGGNGTVRVSWYNTLPYGTICYGTGYSTSLVRTGTLRYRSLELTRLARLARRERCEPTSIC